MCGFVGFWSQKRYSELKNFLPKSSQQLAHRGPDDHGIFFDEQTGIGLAHRRLSIIDLSSAGRQPMSNENGSVQVVYNGEVYNYREIRRELEGYGYHFFSQSDTEVVLKAYMNWGIACLDRLFGMFALTIWDASNKLLYMARDRIGIKPFYYYLKDNTLVFASELKALMCFRPINLHINLDALPLFLHYQYIPAPQTIFKNTYKLMPGTYTVFNGQTTHCETYWNIPEESPVSSRLVSTEDESLEQLENVLKAAVSDRLISDVPFGALLSGGIDSSAVVALIQAVNNLPVKTYSIGFKEKEYNEAPWASKIAAHLGTDHTELYVTPKEALEIVPLLPELYDEPFADSSAIPTFLVCRLARSHIKVALSGDGGDEQFAGYVRYWTTESMSKGLQHLPDSVKKIISFVLGSIPSRWVTQCYLPFRPVLPQRFKLANFEDKWIKLVKQMNQSDIRELYRMTICLWHKSDIQQMVGRGLPTSQYEELFEITEEWSTLSRLMYADQKTYLPDAMLTKVDRASMGVGLEVRVPLLDHRVVEYTATLPESLKYRYGEGKYLLKKLLAGYVPKELFKRPKMGFGVPINRWLRKDLKGMLTDYLSADRLKKEGLFDPNFVTGKINEHLSGQANHQYRLWSLLIWQMWREKWIS